MADKGFDVAVVGCGGWGLAVLKVLQDMGLKTIGIERGELCHNLSRFMRKMTMHSPLPYISLDPADALLAERGDAYHASIEELVETYRIFAQTNRLVIETHCTLQDIKGTKGDFCLEVNSEKKGKFDLKAQLVVLAIGAYDQPNLLGIPGEEDQAVEHYIGEWEQIKNERLLFVGGGFSSADGAVKLCAANKILWVTRKSLGDIEVMLHDQKTKWGQPDAALVHTEILPDSQLLSLADQVACIQTPQGQRQWAFDRCFMLIGHQANGELIERLVQGNIAYDEDTFEARQRPGLFLVGGLAKKNLEHIGLTDRLCPGNNGVRYIEQVREGISKRLGD